MHDNNYLVTTHTHTHTHTLSLSLSLFLSLSASASLSLPLPLPLSASLSLNPQMDAKRKKSHCKGEEREKDLTEIVRQGRVVAPLLWDWRCDRSSGYPSDPALLLTRPLPPPHRHCHPLQGCRPTLTAGMGGPFALRAAPARG